MKKISILLLSVLFILTLTTTSFSEPSSWAKPEIDAARAKGLIIEEADKNYQSAITRGLFCKLIVHLIEQQSVKPIEIVIANPFNDTDNEEIIKAFQLGIVKGVSATQFASEKLINRQEVAVMIMRAFRVLDAMNNKTLTQNVDISGISFNDEASIATWALQDIKEATAFDIIKGKLERKFKPLDSATVEQTILILSRLNKIYEVEHKDIADLTFETTTENMTPMLTPDDDTGYNTSPDTTATTTMTSSSDDLTVITMTEIEDSLITVPLEYRPQPKATSMQISIRHGVDYVFQASDVANDYDGDELLFTSIKQVPFLQAISSPMLDVTISNAGNLLVKSSQPANIGKSKKYIVEISDGNMPIEAEIVIKVVEDNDVPILTFKPAILNVKCGQSVSKKLSDYIDFAKPYKLVEIDPAGQTPFGKLISKIVGSDTMLQFTGAALLPKPLDSKVYNLTIDYGLKTESSFPLIVKYGTETYRPIIITPPIKPPAMTIHTMPLTINNTKHTVEKP